MATASEVLEELGKDFLECGICMQRYTNPKILDCVHTFCEKCLVNYFGNDKVKPCPVCRQEINLPVPGGVGDFKTNGYIVTLRDKIELQEKVAKTSDEARRTCELCTENEVTHHCLNCSQGICHGCIKIHHRIKVSANHTVGTLEDIHNGKVTLPEVQKEYTCIKHKGEINRFYCETCNVLICRDCTVVDHCKPEHQFIGRASASSKYKKFLNEIFPKFINEIERFEGCIEDAYKAQQEFEEKVSQSVQGVKKGADRQRDKVKAEEDRILEEIRVVKEDRNTAFIEHTKLMKSLLQRKQHALTIATDVTNKGSESDFLSLFPTINQNLTFLRSHVPSELDTKSHYLRLNQTLTPESITLGTLDLGDTKWELHREVDGAQTEELYFGWFTDITALRGNKLAVTTTRGEVVIFSTDDGFVKTIKTYGRCCCVASFHYGPVVVTDCGCLQFYNEDFTLSKSFKLRILPKGDHHTCSCTKKDGTILVGHSSEKSITLIHRTNGWPIDTTSISLEKTPRFLATDSNDRVVVSGYDDNKVTVIDDQGVTLVAIKPTVNDQPVGYCSGVCCDGSDIYVAVSNRGLGSGHIHRYDGDGMFLSCIVQGLNHPAGITFTEDREHLAVVDNTRLKFYQKVYFVPRI